MTGRGLAFVGWILGWSVSVCGEGEPATAPLSMRAAFSEMAGKTGDDYLAARGRFLGMDKSTTASYLEAKRASASRTSAAGKLRRPRRRTPSET
jgi:hypothetical protein